MGTYRTSAWQNQDRQHFNTGVCGRCLPSLLQALNSSWSGEPLMRTWAWSRLKEKYKIDSIETEAQQNEMVLGQEICACKLKNKKEEKVRRKRKRTFATMIFLRALLKKNHTWMYELDPIKALPHCCHPTRDDSICFLSSYLAGPYKSPSVLLSPNSGRFDLLFKFIFKKKNNTAQRCHSETEKKIF